MALILIVLGSTMTLFIERSLQQNTRYCCFRRRIIHGRPSDLRMVRYGGRTWQPVNLAYREQKVAKVWLPSFLAHPRCQSFLSVGIWRCSSSATTAWLSASRSFIPTPFTYSGYLPFPGSKASLYKGVADPKALSLGRDTKTVLLLL